MNAARCLCMVAVLLICCLVLEAQTVDEYVQRAEEKSQLGDIEAALKVMEKAVEAFPDDPTSHAFLGGYLTQSAGSSDDMMVKATRSGQAFEHLDKAVALDSTHVYGRFFRGLLSIMVPSFFGKLDQGIDDLNTVLEVAEADPEKAPEDILTRTYHYLGLGYSKKGEEEKARTSWQEVIRRAPDSTLAKEAQAHLQESGSEPSGEVLEGKSGRKFLSGDFEKVQQYIDEGEPEKAIPVLAEMVAADSTNALARAWMGLAYASMAGQGYDERIAGDTDLRTNYALNGFRMVEEAAALAPEDPEVRFLKGMLGAQLPSFMGKTDQAVEDLTYVIEKAPSDELRSEAMYALGLAYRRKGLSVWEELVTGYPRSESVQRVFEQMKPEESRVELNGVSGPLVAVRFAIGFETELEPQTAVWVEDEQGRWVKTLYVSGFSGHVGPAQVVLSKWAEASNFETDANTGASIAAGWHSYLWDLTDHDGKSMKEGTFIVYAEVHHWPSMKYQLASAPIEIGKGENVSKVGAGDLIPYFEVRYIAE